MIAVGKKAPEFSLPADDGSTISLADLKGRKVVLFFYPKDDTPGCTTESCELRDSWSAITAAGALVLGVSPDSVASHAKFSSKFSFPYRLLADTDHAMAEAYGVWGEKSMYGKKYWGILRTTVLLDEQGKVEHVFEKVKPKGHAAEVLEVLRG
jgi:peroxiredoxin Q/BCP